MDSQPTMRRLQFLGVETSGPDLKPTMTLE
ncbi:hypothetical protein RDI58_027103 [Solanum bulbocastanum]|uniref:Uncharacterized protein n=1 Tax=Solanum bulbocastanum TaxID=147425 RepID=A0AAN8T056_SOLBU